MTNRFNAIRIITPATCLLLLGVLPVQGQVLKRNLADLVNLSEYVLVGTVATATDGFDSNGVPYTEVTLDVTDALRGNVDGRYTFRQFGLLEPRDMGNGYTNLNVSPDGWPRFAQGEEVMVFLYQQAALTGLRTTVGLFQGKFTVRDGEITNSISNQGLFDNVSAPASELNQAEAKLLDTKQGKVSADAFISLVRKAVDNGWF